MRLLSKKGITLVELSVFIAAASIVGAAVISVQFNIKRGEKKLQVVNTLLEKKRQFDDVLKEKETFVKTVKNLENLSMICVRNELACPAENVANKFRPDLSRIALYNQHGNLFYDGRGTNSKGFTDMGAECEGFTYGGAGNDNCPIGYIVNWHIAKTDLTDNNSLTISVKLVYNPSDNNPQKKLVNNLIAGADLSPYDSFGSMSLEPNKRNSISPSCSVGAVTLYNGGVYTFFESAVANLGALCKSEIRICTIINDNPRISGSYTNGSCVQNCYGEWSSCSASCGGGTEIFNVTTAAANGGNACPAPTSRTCNTTACVPTGSCTTMHPIGWSGGTGFNSVYCVEYFRPAASTGPIETRTIQNGQTSQGSAGYCVFGSCHGHIRWRCDNGTVTWLEEQCTAGAEP
jgi:hypothetical protein